MDLRAWREAQKVGEPFTLPSGLEVRLRRVSLLDLAEQGQIPAPLAGMVQEVMDSKEHQLQLADFGKFAGVINLVVRATVIEPAIGVTATDEQLGVTELPMSDRLEVFNWSSGGSKTLEPFRAPAAEPAGTA